MAVIDESRLTARTLDEVAFVVGVTRRTVQDWQKRGCPGERGRYPLRAIIEWCKANVWKAKPALVLTGEEAALADGSDSPALERWREARAAMAEIDLQQRQGDMVALEDVAEMMRIAASRFREAGEKLIRKYGNDAGDHHNQACELMEQDFERYGGHGLGDAA